MKSNYKPKTHTQIGADKALEEMFSRKVQSKTSVKSYSRYSGANPQKNKDITVDKSVIFAVLLTISSGILLTYTAYKLFKPKEVRILKEID